MVPVVLLVALAFVACGGDGDGSEATAPGETTSSAAGGAGSDSGKGEAPGAQGGGEAGENGPGAAAGKANSPGPAASDFTPRRHSDSGGGSAQFVQKGGDNSIQEFGSEAGRSDFEAAAAALHNFLDARADGNWAAVCDYMSQGVVDGFRQLAAQSKELQDADCATLLRALTNPAAGRAFKAEAAKADARSLRAEGDRAFLIYTGLEGTVYAMPMAADEDGEWKVAALAGTPLS